MPADNGGMTFRLLLTILAALLCGCAAIPAAEGEGGAWACTTASRREPADQRIQHAIQEARRQHTLFGSQTIERNGGMFRVGRQEAESSTLDGTSAPAWQGVAAFWNALSPTEPADLMTSAGWVPRRHAQGAATSAGAGLPAQQVATHEALLRAAIVDTPWSAAFISYLMKTAGFSGTEFAFSDSHADYVRAALNASESEAAGRPASHAFRACDAATTHPRAGDLLCATRGSTAGIVTFEALRNALPTQSSHFFPMHCDLVVHSGGSGPAPLDTIGGNVIHSVTLSRMMLDASGVLGADYVAGRAQPAHCASSDANCRQHLSRRPWLVLLQFRH